MNRSLPKTFEQLRLSSYIKDKPYKILANKDVVVVQYKKPAYWNGEDVPRKTIVRRSENDKCDYKIAIENAIAKHMFYNTGRYKVVIENEVDRFVKRSGLKPTKKAKAGYYRAMLKYLIYDIAQIDEDEIDRIVSELDPKTGKTVYYDEHCSEQDALFVAFHSDGILIGNKKYEYRDYSGETTSTGITIANPLVQKAASNAIQIGKYIV